MSRAISTHSEKISKPAHLLLQSVLLESQLLLDRLIILSRQEPPQLAHILTLLHLIIEVHRRTTTHTLAARKELLLHNLTCAWRTQSLLAEQAFLHGDELLLEGNGHLHDAAAATVLDSLLETKVVDGRDGVLLDGAVGVDLGAAGGAGEISNEAFRDISFGAPR